MLQHGHFWSLTETHSIYTQNRLTQRDSSRYSSPVDPKRNPGEQHHKHCGKVRLQHEEENVSSEDEVYVQPVIPA